jgi:hypothetical protein
MSSELERRLREGREALGEPDPETTERAREAALGAARRHRPVRWRSSLVLACALAAAVAVGVGIGAFVAPSGTAAGEPAGIGFLPADGWYVTQNATQATEQHPAHAIASNVPLQPGDGGSIVPYSTLLGLPEDGIVVVANFMRADFLPGLTYGPRGTMGYPEDRLPLRLADFMELDEFGSLVRPEQPLGQYKRQAEIEGYSVEIDVYFGTQQPSRELLDEAQRQLEQLIVAPERAEGRRGALRNRARS